MNLLYGRRLRGRYIYIGKTTSSGSQDDTPATYLPGVFKIICYKDDGTISAEFGAGAKKNAVSSFNFKNGETGCGQCTITFKQLPTNSELNYKQRVDIFLFNDNKPWWSGYVLTRPVKGTTETTYTFTLHGYYNLLEKVQVFKTYENKDAAEIVRDIAKTAEKKIGLVYNAEKLINTGYLITKVVFDGVTVKEALSQLCDFGIDYVYGVDERRSLYFKPRVSDINEQARFWIGKNLDSYIPTWNIEKIVNWARIKGANVDDEGESWLATVEDTESQATYGLQEDIWTLPSAYEAADAERWGKNQIEKYKNPVKSAKIKNIKLEYNKPDGTFNVRKLSTDGECVITDRDGNSVQYPISTIKYSVSSAKGIYCEMELGEQPFTIEQYFAKLEREYKNTELLQQASNQQLTT